MPICPGGGIIVPEQIDPAQSHQDIRLLWTPSVQVQDVSEEDIWLKATQSNISQEKCPKQVTA